MNLYLDATLLAKRLLALICLTVFIAAPSAAIAVDLYDENLSGDAPAGGPSINLGSLPVGSGRIVGGNLDFDTDDFSFTIAAGLQLRAIAR